MFYEKLVRPFLFSMNPERAHLVASKSARFFAASPAYSLIKNYYSVTDSALKQQFAGFEFRNPVGLAGGFDKQGTFVNTAAMLGAGFHEVGSVSAQAREGNPQPRLLRIPEEKSLVNKMGLNNDGAEETARRLESAVRRIPLIINVAKTHDSAIVGDAAVADYCKSVQTLLPVADLITINISCPNTKEGITFQEPSTLNELLHSVMDVRRQYSRETILPTPIGIKIGPDVVSAAVDGHYRQLEAVVEVAMCHNVSYFVCCNTLPTQHPVLEKCGKSGYPLRRIARQGVAALYQLCGKNVPIIGVGGVFSADDAFALMEAGASLVQIYTGFVYKGPSLFRDINQGLVERLDTEGVEKLSRVIGRSYQKVLQEADHG